MERLRSPRLSVNVLLLGLILGLALGGAAPVLPSKELVAMVFAFSLLLLFFYVRYQRTYSCYFAVIMWALCGSILHGHHLQERRLPHSLAGSDWFLTGVVTSLPELTENGERFHFQVEEVLRAPSNAEAYRPQTLRLSDYRGGYRQTQVKSFTAVASQESTFEPGSRWQLWVRLKPPRGFVNEGGFDYEGWLLQQGYDATGYVRQRHSSTRLEDYPCGMDWTGIKICFVQRSYQWWQWIQQHVSAEHRALFAALTVGAQEGFTRAQWDTLRDTGTIHLVVVSGMHISLMAAFGYAVVSVGVRILFFPLKLFPSPVWAIGGAVVFATIYAGLSGFTLPVQRAWAVVLCGLVALLFRQSSALSTSFLWACCLVLCLDPLALFSVSFWLSFGAVALLLYCFAHRRLSRHPIRWLYLGIATQCAISFGMAPLIAFWIGSVPAVTPVANLFAIPYITFLVLPLTLLVLLFSKISLVTVEYLLPLCDWSMDFFWWMLNQFQRFDGMMYFVEGRTSHWVVMILAVAGVLLGLAPSGVLGNRVYQYGLSAILLFPLMFPWQREIPLGEFEVTLLDVGQGLSIMIETQHHMTVYDTGDQFSEQFDVGGDILAGQIRRRGHRRIHTLLISHSDSDHAGGMEGLLASLPVDYFLSGNAAVLQQRLENSVQLPPDLRHFPVHDCYAGQSWQVDGVQFRVLSPSVHGWSGGVTRKNNNFSCVVKVYNSHASLLLTGDILADQERWLLAQEDASWLASDLLVVPHHGSKSSSTSPFLEAVKPRLALTSVGYRSHYGHPHPEVTERYRQMGIPFYRSDQSGALRVSSVDGFHSLHEARQQSGRYWHLW